MGKANSTLRSGDRIVFGRCKRNSDMAYLTAGRIYTVVCDEWSTLANEPVIMDDEGDFCYFAACGYKATKIVN